MYVVNIKMENLYLSIKLFRKVLKDKDYFFLFFFFLYFPYIFCEKSLID